jgi:NAD+ synthase
LGVSDTFDAAAEIERRIVFLADYLRAAGGRAYVLGISGGIDSLTAGLFAQAAAERLRNGGQHAEFVAMRLPYGNQADEEDAQKALAVIRPDRIVTVDIKPAADAMLDEARRAASDLFQPERQDFHHGNIKARQRMIAQFAIAGAMGGLVIGTDHAAEALMGFFTKFGDGAAETNAPLRPDEEVYGVTYDEIDDFLEGKPISMSACERILGAHRVTAHKRALPITPQDL